MVFDLRSFLTGVLIAVGVGILGYMTLGGHTHSHTDDPSMGHFESHHVGLEFNFPDSYDQKLEHVGSEEHQHHIVVLTDRGLSGGEEGPNSITIANYDAPEGVSLEGFLQNMVRDARDQQRNVASTSVGGEPALFYQTTGLYEYDHVAVRHGDEIFIFSVGWMKEDDQIHKDFDAIIKDVSFIED